MKYFWLLLLAGCAILPQSYDAVLYDHYVQATLVVKNTAALCNNPQAVIHNIQDVVTTLDGTLLYEKYRNEALLIQATTIVRDDLNQLLYAYSKQPIPSSGYCHLKLQITEDSLEHILEAIGGKPQ